MSHTVESFQIEGWRDPITGLTLAESDDWVLVRYIPVDFLLDGYRLIRKEVVVRRIQAGAEALVARVMALRDASVEVPEGFVFGDAEFMLRWVERNFELFQFQDDEEDEAVIGRIDSISDGYMELVFVDDEGVEDAEYDIEYPLSRIHLIEFDTDYIDGIRRLWQDNQQG